MARSVRMLAACFATLVLCSSALAGPAPQTHDGFFLRLSLGGGGATTSVEYFDVVNNVPNEELTLEGSASDFNLAIGGMIGSRTALHATLLGVGMEDPDLDYRSTGEEPFSGTFMMAGLGVGLTQYFMPSNFYISGTLGTAAFELDEDGVENLDSEDGFFGELTVGKEWWVSDNWGLGVALGATMFRISDEDDDDWEGGSFTIRFSATYN